jgi:hypothetical protein
MAIELLPCPCCGSPAHFFKINDDDSRDHGGEGICCGRSDLCLTTGLMFACGEDVKPMLAELWNRRPAPTTEPTAKPITGLTGEMVMSAHALCPTDMSHPKRMAWMAKVLTRALAEKNGLAVQGDGT